MALVVTDEVEQEALRITSCKSAFEVLELNPRQCDKEDVLRQYETKVVLFKRLFRNKLAMQAKARLDDAKMRLLDERFRTKEFSTYNESMRDHMKDKHEITLLEARTRQLEVRALSLAANAST